MVQTVLCNLKTIYCVIKNVSIDISGRDFSIFFSFGSGWNEKDSLQGS